MAGNTPPLFLPDGDWSWPRREGESLLRMLRGLALEADATPSVYLEEPDPSVEFSVYRTDGRWCVMLVHTGTGMHRGGHLVFPEFKECSPEVLADFDPRAVSTEGAETSGTLELPSFSDCCLVQW